MPYYSQIGQDQWVLSVLGPKKNGFFIELGACDGLYLSNSLYFEKELEWNGICIEPNDSYFQELKKNRKCLTVNDLISSEAGKEVEFINSDAAGSINDETVGHFITNKNNKSVKITNTLANVLDRHGAPNVIDYLSLDVEGHEYEILKTFPFDKYKFRCITVEHNEPHVGDVLQMNIRKLLLENGYSFVKGNDDILNWKHGPIDDFYIYNF